MRSYFQWIAVLALGLGLLGGCSDTHVDEYFPGTGGAGGMGGAAGTGGTAGTGGSGGTGGIQGTEYAQDFESLVQTSETALYDDPNPPWGVGWLVFGNVFNSGGSFDFAYGSNLAPNSTAFGTADGFSGIASGEGGPEQGDQQLVIFSDYQCCGGDQGHSGTDDIESNVYRERTITLDDVDKTITFSFDAKRGNINDPTGSSTALAFIKTLDLDLLDNDPTTDFVFLDTTKLPDTWMRYEVSLALTDPLLQGKTLQFGFSSTASNSEPSGVFYDNIRVVLEAP